LDGFSALSAADQKRLQKAWENGTAEHSEVSEDSDSGKKTTGKRKKGGQKTEGKRKRKKKEVTDGTDKVKRGRSGYIFFCNEKRADVTKENPELKAKEIMKELGARWANLTEEEKKTIRRDAKR